MRGTWHLERMGLAGLDAIAREVESRCLGRPGHFGFWEYLYGHLGSMAARHDDCARAQSFYQRLFSWGTGPRGFTSISAAYPWCGFDFAESTWPTKVRIIEFSFATDHHAQHHDEARRAAISGLHELLAEELIGRGIAVEQGGGSHGGVFGVYGSYDEASQTLTLKYSGALNQPDVVASVVLGDRLDVTALLAPLLPQLRPGPERGPCKANPSLPMGFVTGYGQALALPDTAASRDAFTALAKRYPQFRLAKVRAEMAAERVGAN
jgi:hypothetical protein